MLHVGTTLRPLTMLWLGTTLLLQKATPTKEVSDQLKDHLPERFDTFFESQNPIL